MLLYPRVRQEHATRSRPLALQFARGWLQIARHFASRRVQPAYLVQVAAPVPPVKYGSRLPMPFEQFQIEILENDGLNIRRTLGGDSVSLEGNVRRRKDA